MFFGSIAVELLRQWIGPAKQISILPTAVSDRLSSMRHLLGPTLLAFTCLVPLIFYDQRYILDLSILVLTYVMLGWGLNIVVGLAGLLDLGYVAFYAVGAYSYALLAKFGLPFLECDVRLPPTSPSISCNSVRGRSGCCFRSRASSPPSGACCSAFRCSD